MGNTLESGLIQMNAHMVVESSAISMMVIGAVLAVLMFMVAIYELMCDGPKKFAWIWLMIGLAGVAMFLLGTSTPRVQEIRACAYGPVSLEEVAVKYEIVNIDGKELTLRVR